MAIRIVEIKPAASPETLNNEWIVLENDGKTPFHTRGCGVTVGRRGSAKKSLLGIIDPGFVLLPGEKIRMLTGSPGREADPPPSEEAIKNYYLLLPRSYLSGGAGTVLTLVLRGLAITKAELDPTQPGSVAAPIAKK
ncbi:MAG TPA: hypothetical protein VGM88_23690 [Kofleriaceae bacterium]|jgi:hypothetical protein